MYQNPNWRKHIRDFSPLAAPAICGSNLMYHILCAPFTVFSITHLEKHTEKNMDNFHDYLSFSVPI